MTKPRVTQHHKEGHVHALWLDDGRTGVACEICKRGWLTPTFGEAMTQAASHRNNICELASLLPDRSVKVYRKRVLPTCADHNRKTTSTGVCAYCGGLAETAADRT